MDDTKLTATIDPNSMMYEVYSVNDITSVAIRIMRCKEWGGTNDARSKGALQATHRSLNVLDIIPVLYFTV